MGFRIPIGFSSVKDKYERSKDRYKIFCLGDSTTFGSYHDYESTYPAFLEQMTGAAVFNLGLQEMDLHSNIYALVDALYQGLRPDLVICHDGANEINGFKQVMRGQDNYSSEHSQYQGFVDMQKSANLKHRLRMFLSNLKGRFREQPQSEIDPEEILRFAREQAWFYLSAKAFMKELAERFDFKVVFFLQPSACDCWQDGDALGAHQQTIHRYYKATYREILSAGSDTTDLSSMAGLELDMFIDFVHIDRRGNEAIAREIYSHIGSRVGKEIR